MTAEASSTAPKTTWTDVVAAKRAIQSEHIEKHRSTPETSPLNTKITDTSDIGSLTQLLESGVVSAEDVVKAYIAT